MSRRTERIAANLREATDDRMCCTCSYWCGHWHRCRFPGHLIMTIGGAPPLGTCDDWRHHLARARAEGDRGKAQAKGMMR